MTKEVNDVWLAVRAKARQFADNYRQGTDGRNTFIIFSEWAESQVQRADAASALPQGKQAAYQHLQQADALLHEADQTDPHVVAAHRLVREAATHLSESPQIREQTGEDDAAFVRRMASGQPYNGTSGVSMSDGDHARLVALANISTPTPPQDAREGEDEPVLQDGPLTVIMRDTIKRIYEVALAEHEASRPAPAAQPSAPAVQGEWLPIESAPRDGTQLLCVEYDDSKIVVTVHWYWENLSKTEGSWRGEGGQPRRPTQWHPFPAPPSITSPVAGDAVAIVEKKAELYGKYRSPRPQRELYNRGRLDAANEILAALRVSSKGER